MKKKKEDTEFMKFKRFMKMAENDRKKAEKDLKKFKGIGTRKKGREEE